MQNICLLEDDQYSQPIHIRFCIPVDLSCYKKLNLTNYTDVMVSCFVSPEMSECLIDAHLTQMGGCPCIRLVNLSPISPLSTAELTDTMTIKYFSKLFHSVDEQIFGVTIYNIAKKVS